MFQSQLSIIKEQVSKFHYELDSKLMQDNLLCSEIHTNKKQSVPIPYDFKCKNLK